MIPFRCCRIRGCVPGWMRYRRSIAPLSPKSLAGNVSAHIVYCMRQTEQQQRADFVAPHVVPVTREIPGPHLANSIQPDGTIAVLFDGIRLPLALPALAPAILRLVDGRRTVGEIASVLAERGTSAEAFARAWRATFEVLERINRLLLAAPLS